MPKKKKAAETEPEPEIEPVDPTMEAAAAYRNGEIGWVEFKARCVEADPEHASVMQYDAILAAYDEQS